jgi:hypothetical protein
MTAVTAAKTRSPISRDQRPVETEPGTAGIATDDHRSPLHCSPRKVVRSGHAMIDCNYQARNIPLVGLEFGGNNISKSAGNRPIRSLLRSWLPEAKEPPWEMNRQ